MEAIMRPDEPPLTPRTESTARSEMSSRRLRELERSSLREPLTLSGRTSDLWCTPASLANTELSTEERAERARKDASARFEREKLRLSMTPATPVTSGPPLSVIKAQPPPSDARHSSHDKENWCAPDDAGSSSSSAAERARDELIDKIVWLAVTEDEEVAARVRCIVAHQNSSWLLGVELLQQPPDALEHAITNGRFNGLQYFVSDPPRALFVPPATVTLLSMKELLDLPPPPPPPPPPDGAQQSISQSPGRQPQRAADCTPPCLRQDDNPEWIVPAWASKDQLEAALRSQRDPPPELNCEAKTCSIVHIFNRPSLAAREGRETSDWSIDDW